MKKRYLVFKSEPEDVVGPYNSGNENSNIDNDIVIIHPNGKVGLTGTGGLCIKLTNVTNTSTTKGNLVSPSTSSANSFELSINDYDSMGVVYESGIAHGQDAWVVVSGIADVLVTNSSSYGGWVRSQGLTQAGKGLIDSSPESISALSTQLHFKEVGHSFQTAASGSNYLVRTVIHFN